MVQRVFDPELCIYCPDLCLHSCPAVHGTGNNAASPYGKVNAIYWATKSSRWPRDEASELSFLCTECNLCTEVCDHEQPVADFLFTHRQECFSDQNSPSCSENICPDEDELSKCLNQVTRKFRSKRSSSVLFFPGCDLLAQGPERIEKIMHLLARLGVQDLGIAPSTPICCGGPWRDLGDMAGFMARGIKWRRHFSKSNGVIIGDSRCLRSLSRLQSVPLEKGPGPRFFSLWEVLLRSIRSPLKPKLDLKVGLLKSCHLSRDLGRPRMPRALFESLFVEPPVLFSDEGVEELCCGFSGGMAQTHPNAAKAAAQMLLNQAKLLECDALLSLSPSCAAHLKSALKDEPDQPEVLDLVDVLLRAYGMEDSP